MERLGNELDDDLQGYAVN